MGYLHGRPPFEYDRDRRRYRIDGREVPSVSTRTQRLTDRSRLQEWAARVATRPLGNVTIRRDGPDGPTG